MSQPSCGPMVMMSVCATLCASMRCSSEYGVDICRFSCLHIYLPQVTQHIATCQPLSTALDNGHVILCDMMADPWVSVPNPPWIQSKWKGAGGGHEPRHVESVQGL